MKPSDLSDGPVVVKMKSHREDCLPQTLTVVLVNGKAHMNVTNNGQGELHINRGPHMGVIDLRSAGYFNITRDSIQRYLHERFISLSEEESQDYLSLMHTINDKTPQKNGRLDIWKTPIDEIEKSPRESKYSKDNTKKDPYPWLDENDPRRHITEKEIFERTIDLSEACVTEMQKQTLHKIPLKFSASFSLGHGIGIMSKYGSKIGFKGQDTILHQTLSN